MGEIQPYLKLFLKGRPDDRLVAMLLPDAFYQEVLGAVCVAVDVACYPGIRQLLRPRKVHIETERR